MYEKSENFEFTRDSSDWKTVGEARKLNVLYRRGDTGDIQEIDVFVKSERREWRCYFSFIFIALVFNQPAANVYVAVKKCVV